MTSFNRLLISLFIVFLAGMAGGKSAGAACDSDEFLCDRICCPKGMGCTVYPSYPGKGFCSSVSATCPDNSYSVCFNREENIKTCCPADSLGCGLSLGCLVPGVTPATTPPSGGGGGRLPGGFKGGDIVAPTSTEILIQGQ